MTSRMVTIVRVGVQIHKVPLSQHLIMLVSLCLCLLPKISAMPQQIEKRHIYIYIYIYTSKQYSTFNFTACKEVVFRGTCFLRASKSNLSFKHLLNSWLYIYIYIHDALIYACLMSVCTCVSVF
jgi:hypothetical protein